jgi:hypothetical protein
MSMTTIMAMIVRLKPQVQLSALVFLICVHSWHECAVFVPPLIC